MSVGLRLELGQYGEAVGGRLATWGRSNILARMWAKDHTIWSAEPVAELADRLGWLGLPERMSQVKEDLQAFGEQLASEGVAHVVVLGMGGSSLAPEVFAKTFGSALNAPQLQVLDSTHPGAILAMADSLDISRTVFIVASKSGTTIEPLSFMEYFWSRVVEISDDPGRHFVATTDPGSELETVAHERGFRRVFLAPPDVGGRYSALTEFGLVPAASIGIDLEALWASAMAAQLNNAADATIATSAGCRLGAAMGELALAGRDKITFLTSPDIDALPAWIEQLIAESTGKQGRGIVPIGGEPIGSVAVYGADRFFVLIRTTASPEFPTSSIADHPIAAMTLDSLADIAGAMYTFEIATALAGEVIGIQPFDQPDVQLAKVLARDAMAGMLDTTNVVEIDAMAPDLGDHVADWLGAAEPGDYVGINAFIQPTATAKAALAAARVAVRDGTGLATTLDFGPRFLHSTGQLHKGGPNTGLFLEIIDHAAPPVAVPTTDYDFARLITAQSLGDHIALRQRHRRVLLVNLGDGGNEALERIAAALTTASQ